MCDSEEEKKKASWALDIVRWERILVFHIKNEGLTEALSLKKNKSIYLNNY